MRITAWFVLATLLAVSLPAMAANQPAVPPPAASPPSADQDRLPLAAMRHQQPRRDEVDARERTRLGPSEAQALQRERAQEDELYDEIMRNSAPPGTVR